MLCVPALAGFHTATAQMNTDRLTAIGRNALYFEDYVLAIQYFNQVIRLKPYLAEPYLFRAIAKINLGDLQGAEKDCSICIENSPFLPGAYYTRGFVYRGLQEFDRAEQDFSEALVLAPENKTYLLLRADVRSQQKNFDEALKDIDHLLQREPESASLNYERAVILINKEDTLGALEYFTNATIYDSQNAANWSAKGMVNCMLNNENEGLQDLTQAIELGSEWAGDYVNRGIILYRKQNYRGALSDYDKAVQLDPDNDHIYYNRGLLRYEMGDYTRALEDYDKALQIDPDNTEVYYQRGVLNLQLKKWRAALTDFEVMMEKYPYFLPCYYLAAQAKAGLGDSKGAAKFREKAYAIEMQKDKILAQQKQVNTTVQVSQAQSQKRDKRFSNTAAQSQQANEAEDRYHSGTRGAIQNRYTDVVNQPNVVLSYYAPQDLVRRAYYHYSVDNLNQRALLPSPLRFTQQEIALTAEMVNLHFDQINKLTYEIQKNAMWLDAIDSVASADFLHKVSMTYFARAIEFALVQDYNSAIEDCNEAIFWSAQSSEKTIMYFCRANWRYKLLEYLCMSGEEVGSERLKLEFEMILRDYDQVILTSPDFAFAYYNKANILCNQRDFQAAMTYYQKAIEQEPDLAEAYYNRGLVEVFVGDNEAGLADLSKAGELGLYQAYNMISRFK